MKEICLDSPLKGQLIELKDVKDPAFASGAMGKGAAVKDPEGKVYSPVDGTVTVLFGTKHAIGIHSEDGADILIHVGIDTVNLGGKYFDAKIEQGDAIKKGQLLLEFDPEGIKSAGYDTTTPVLVTNAFDYDKITVALGDKEITTVTAESAEEEAPAAEAPAEPEEDYSDLPKEERVAKLIWKYVGGRDNVRSAEHCATRLRLIINDKSKLTTSLFGRYSMYKSTKLNYNNADNPQPNYWKNLPSSYYDVWYNDMESYITDQAYNDWKDSYNYWRASKANRQINWDRLYASNQNINAAGKDAMYYVEAKHNNNLTVSLASTYNHQIDAKKSFNLGFVAATNKGMHYVTMEDLLGANTFHNINTYAISDIYNAHSDEVQYDLRNRNAVVKEGDRFRYDYNLLVNTGKVWGSYTEDFGNLHYTVAGRLGYTNMQRDGKMQNGLAANNSYGKSKHAEFVDGGLKFGSTLNMGHGNTLIFGIGYEHRAPQARNAFMAPEINNNFVRNLKNERVFSTELGYQYENAWMHLNLNAYYSRLDNVTDWQNFYHDDINSFEYVSLTDMKKEYYGVEAGVKFKVTSAFDVKLLGTISDAKIINNAKLAYMESVSGAMHGDDYGTEGDTNTNWDRVYNKGMRDNGTPLTAASLGVNYHQNGWFLSLNCNYYDRIYLSYSPNYRYRKSIENRKQIMSQRGIEIMDENNEPRESALSQAKGHGGFMLDGSIGRSIYLKHGSLSINLSLTNILNNRNIVTGGFEQSRSDYSGDKDNVKSRAYAFSKNPYKFYAFGTNGMLNLTYKF